MGNGAMQPVMAKLGVYIIPFLSFCVVCFQPGTVQLYFLVTGFFALMQSRFLSSPAVRDYLGLYPNPSQDNTTLVPSSDPKQSSGPTSLGTDSSSLSIYQPPSPPSPRSAKDATSSNDATMIDRFAD